jgi:hypothetical protein
VVERRRTASLRRHSVRSGGGALKRQATRGPLLEGATSEVAEGFELGA